MSRRRPQTISLSHPDSQEPMRKSVTNRSLFRQIGLTLGLCFAWVMLGWGLVQAEDESCLECHPDVMKRLTKKNNHPPFTSEDCYVCHSFHGYRNEVTLKGTVIDVCSHCHTTYYDLNEDELHYPLTEEDESCISCHDPHGSDHPSLLKQDLVSTCIECHDAPDPEDNNHLPYANAECTNCHDPHGSAFGTFFVMPLAYMCLSCHQSVLDGIPPSQMHTADEISSCENCHVGHVVDHPGMLKKPMLEVCSECHEDIADEVKETPVHTVLEDDECTVCHTPHFGPSDNHLLDPQRELCFGCHSDIEELIEAEYVHSPLEDEDCTMCHSPHVQQLTESQFELCGGCHDTEDADYEKIHISLNPSSCVDCHNPHGSNNEVIINSFQHSPFEDRECDACHESGQTPEELADPELCLLCHDEPDDSPPHNGVMAENKSCIDCHSPHASPEAGLIRSTF